MTIVLSEVYPVKRTLKLVVDNTKREVDKNLQSMRDFSYICLRIGSGGSIPRDEMYNVWSKSWYYRSEVTFNEFNKYLLELGLGLSIDLLSWKNVEFR